MTAVLLMPPFLQFIDNDGAPLAFGKVYTYSAGSTTPKATYTTAAGNVETTNPITLDANGRATIWGTGSYKFYTTDSLGNPVGPNGGFTDNVTSFSTLAEAASAFFQSFSGDGTTATFTLSETMGTDEKGLMIFEDKGFQQHATNGSFATDTGWTKGSGWTIAAGVATATGAISTALSQTSAVTLVAGQSYIVTYTATRSAGGIIPSVGGTAGTERTSAGTYTENIICGSTQTLAFTGNAFTGTVDNVSITPIFSRGYEIKPPTAYTIDGVILTMATAPASGTGNLLVFAPSTLLGAASAAAAAAAISETNAAAAQVAAEAARDIAKAAAGFQYTYDTDTTGSDPGSGLLRFNNATLASATALYISETTGGSQGIAAEIATWDDSTSTIHGKLRMFKQSNPAIFALFNVTGTLTDNGSWDTLTVAYVSGSGSFSDNDVVTIQYIRNGDKGDTGSQGVPGAFLPIVDAGGAADTITANYSPDVTVADKLVVAVIAANANATTTPTFSPDGATARTIVKKGGQALAVGDIAGAGHCILLEYNAANTRWELLNPAVATAAATTIQYLTSGSSATYTTPAGCRAIRVRAVAGGGGGGSSGAAGTGGTTTFNSVNAVGGGPADVTGATQTGGIGGTGGTGSATFRMAGARGSAGGSNLSGMGGSSAMGPGAGGTEGGTGGRAAPANSGGGGSGVNGASGGGGGGGGEYFELYIASPSATYTYTIGAGGTAGSGGSGGGAGGSGLIIVEEFYG